jgi:hypothetical protein
MVESLATWSGYFRSFRNAIIIANHFRVLRQSCSIVSRRRLKPIMILTEKLPVLLIGA